MIGYPKYERDTTVYNWYFDLVSLELKCDKLQVAHYEYMDGSQWNVIDEYKLYREKIIPYFKFFTKKEITFIRLPGGLISNNKIEAKILLFTKIAKDFGYMLEPEYFAINDNTVEITRIAVEGLKELSDTYPELLIKTCDAILYENNTGHIWR